MRMRIWIFCIAFGAILLAMVWILQVFLLNRFHFNAKVETIREVVQFVDDNYTQLDMQTFAKQAQELSSQKDLYINIMRNPSEFSFAANPVGRSYGPAMGRHHANDSDKWYYDSPLPTVYLSSFYQAVKYSDEPYLTARVQVIPSYPMLLYGERVIDSQGKENVLVVSAPLYPLAETVRILQKQMIVISVVTIILTLLIAWWMSWYVSTPFRRLNRQAQLLATGDFDEGMSETAFIEAQQMAHTLVATNKRLNQTEELRNELIANLTHDLRTPLTMMRLYAEMIHDFDDEKERELQAEVIMQECDRLSEMVQNVLDYSKMRAGVVDYNPEVFDLKETADAVLLRYLPLDTEEYELRSLIEQPAAVWGECKSIERILFNLINNAIHHSEGKVHITIRAQDMGEHIRVHVTDDGPGIEPEQLKDIWARYFTAKTTRKTAKTKNIGLGLSIVAAIMELHHMPYGVDSTPGQGSDFWIELQKVH